MRYLIISILILYAVASNSLSVNTINISQDSGMAILANLIGNSSNQSASQGNVLQNQTNQTGNSSKNAAGDLWSWGKIPIGYEVDKNGSLIRPADQEWAPSI